MAHLYSMTGFGKATLNLSAKKFTIEVKSLNSKQIDMNVRLPQLYKEKEPVIRQILSKECGRGKIDLNFYCEVTGPEKAPKLNAPLISSYVLQLKSIMKEVEVQGDILSAVMRLPDVTVSAEDEVDEDEWRQVEATLRDAVEKLNDFRADEGARLKEDLSDRVSNIREKLAAIEPHEEDRIQRVKDRLQRSLEELSEKQMDENRYEQELIYYLEKLDVTEEKVRLKSHLDYFDQLMEQGGPIGKKLGFIGQEMGREINTLGSKANHAEIQKLVVEMKDELEKIKEQVLNIL